MKKDPLTIIFGAWDRPTKGIISLKDGAFGKGGGVAICELSGKLPHEFGRDKNVLDDIDGVYAYLWFCKKESLDSVIACLSDLRNKTDWGEADEDE